MKRLGCRWVGTCASSSDASPLYIHDRRNVVQWKGSSLPSSQCTSSDQCIFGKMRSDESRIEIFHRNDRQSRTWTSISEGRIFCQPFGRVLVFPPGWSVSGIREIQRHFKNEEASRRTPLTVRTRFLKTDWRLRTISVTLGVWARLPGVEENFWSYRKVQ